MIGAWLGGLLARFTRKAREQKPYQPLPPHPANVPGSFYVEDGCCLSCGVWEDVAPDLLAWLPDGSYSHCFVSRQPETSDIVRRRYYRPMLSQRLKFTSRDDGIALILPPDMLTHMNVAIGDTIYATLIPGGIELTPTAPGQSVGWKEEGNVDDETGN